MDRDDLDFYWNIRLIIEDHFWDLLVICIEMMELRIMKNAPIFPKKFYILSFHNTYSDTKIRIFFLLINALM